MKRTPLRRKAPRRRADQTAEDRDYLAWIGSLPCTICALRGHVQTSKTDAHHFGPRGLGQRAPDRQAIPLCHHEHHVFGREAVHQIGKRFGEHHGIDVWAEIERLNQEFAEAA